MCGRGGKIEWRILHEELERFRNEGLRRQRYDRDSALGVPHRGVKGQVYKGGTLVPGLIEWPARVPRPRVSSFRACTSDLLPTLCALVGQPLPNRPLDGIDLTLRARWQAGRAPEPSRVLGVQHHAARSFQSQTLDRT